MAGGVTGWKSPGRLQMVQKLCWSSEQSSGRPHCGGRDSRHKWGGRDCRRFAPVHNFDRGALGVPTGGRYTVPLPKATVAPWLSDFGKRARQQTLSPSAGFDLGATNTPTAPVPTHTAEGDDPTDCKKVKCIALTFDDGPAAPYTSS
ncbi:hypothetical protein GCM10010304_40540 [Streptomyces roseoviolaceus]